MIKNEKFIVEALEYIKDHLEHFGYLPIEFIYEENIYDFQEVYEGLYKLDDRFDTGASWGN